MNISKNEQTKRRTRIMHQRAELASYPDDEFPWFITNHYDDRPDSISLDGKNSAPGLKVCVTIDGSTDNAALQTRLSLGTDIDATTADELREAMVPLLSGRVREYWGWRITAVSADHMQIRFAVDNEETGVFLWVYLTASDKSATCTIEDMAEITMFAFNDGLMNMIYEFYPDKTRRITFISNPEPVIDPADGGTTWIFPVYIADKCLC